METGLSNKQLYGLLIAANLMTYAYQWRLAFLESNINLYLLYIRSILYTLIFHCVFVLIKVLSYLLLTQSFEGLIGFISNDVNVTFIKLTLFMYLPVTLLVCLVYLVLSKLFRSTRKETCAYQTKKYNDKDTWAILIFAMPFIFHISRWYY